MPGAVWLSGDFVERDHARISAFDAAVQHGVGLFETMLARASRVFRADAHLSRLAHSARELGLSSRLRVGPLAETLSRVVQRAALDRARVRLTITGGDLNMLAQRAQAPTDPSILIVAQPATDYPTAMFERGVSVVVADWRVNPLDPFAAHKTLWYWPRLRALQHAAARGAGEALVCTVSNHVAGGAVSNLFLVKGDRLLTPIARAEEEMTGAQLPSPVLPGVTRAAVIEFAQALGLTVERAMLSIGDVLDADEAMLTNSGWGVLPVTRVEAATISNGAVGKTTRRLRELWLEAVELETKE